jgi:hypothetical protein
MAMEAPEKAMLLVGNLVKVRKCLNGEIEVGILGLERSANKKKHLTIERYGLVKKSERTRYEYTANALYRKFETNIPRNETALPHSQFLFSCMCYIFPRSVCKRATSK